MSVAQLREKEADRRFPLCWPADQLRTPALERVWGQFKGSLDAARRELLYELDQLIYGKDARLYTARGEVIISSNYRLRADGEIHASAKEPEDPGVAVYFTRKKKPMCFACDKYDLVWKNIRAMALPQSTGAGWDSVLELDSATATVDDVQSAYRRLAKVYHTDGSAPDTEKFHAIQQALRDATQQLGGHLRPTDKP